MIERWNPLWEDNRVPHLCQAWSRQTCLWVMMIMLTKIYCKDTENELKSYHNKTDWANFVWMQDSWMLLKSDSISWQKILQNFHKSQIQWPVVSTLCQETKIRLNQKVGSEGTPKLGPYWKLQPVACKVNMELRSELIYEQRQFSFVGPNFSWIDYVGYELEQQRARNLRNAVRRICVKIEGGWFCKPIKGKSKTT